jgi:hypothetical protein
MKPHLLTWNQATNLIAQHDGIPLKVVRVWNEWQINESLSMWKHDIPMDSYTDHIQRVVRQLVKVRPPGASLLDRQIRVDANTFPKGHSKQPRSQGNHIARFECMQILAVAFGRHVYRKIGDKDLLAMFKKCLKMPVRKGATERHHLVIDFFRMCVDNGRRVSIVRDPTYATPADEMTAGRVLASGKHRLYRTATPDKTLSLAGCRSAEEANREGMKAIYQRSDKAVEKDIEILREPDSFNLAVMKKVRAWCVQLRGINELEDREEINIAINDLRDDMERWNTASNR